MKWAIRVTYPSGEDAWLRHGSRIGAGPMATFATRQLAEINAEMIRPGLEDCTITIVRRPKDAPVRKKASL